MCVLTMIIFFTTKDFVTPRTVMHHIDNNHRTLKRNDDKFYMLSINPSGEEQSHLIEKVTGKKVGEFSELTAGEQEEVLAELKNSPADAWTNMPGTFTGRKSSPVMIWYGMDVWKRNAIIKAMIPRWKPAGQKPVKGNRDCNCMCILSSLAWTRHRPYPFPPFQKQGEQADT